MAENNSLSDTYIVVF